MKQKFINSISLLAVCAVLSGCGEANKQKSVADLTMEVGKDSQRLSVLSREALAAAKRGGVPLSFEAQKLFEDDIAEGSAPSPATAKEALGELEETISDLEILENQNSELPIVVKAKQTKRAKMKGLRDLMFARARAAAAARAAGKPVNPDDELSLTVPNDSFLGGAPNPSPMATVAAAAVQSLFPSTARAFGSVNALTVLDQVPAPGEFRVIMPGASRTPDSSSTIEFGVNRAAFSAGVGNTVELWFSAAQPISTSEAVRQTIELGVGVSHITGAVLGANADPALVASLTNIGALDMAQRSTAFKALSLPQQRLALQAAVAIAQATLVGKDQLRLEDRFNAVVLAIAALPAVGAPEDRIAAVQRALQSQGVTNPLLLTDTMRALTVMAQTADMTSKEQARVLGTVLMISNNSGGSASDDDYAALVAAARSNPGLLLGPTVSMPARFALDPSVLTLLKQRMASLDTLPWSAASTSAAFIEAAGQQAQQLIAAGAPTDSISSSLVTSLTAARREKNSLVPATNGSVGIFGDSSDSGLSLAQTIQLLPTTTALDILVVAQETAVQALSATREAVVPFLAITDGSSAVNIPIDPAVEFAKFMEKYKSLSGSDQHTLLLSQLKFNIESIFYDRGNFRRFVGVPASKGKSIVSGLDSLCALPDKYAELLYSADARDEIVIPRLVDFILNNKKLASKLEYYTNGASGDGSRRSFETIKEGNPDLYNKLLGNLGAQVDKYLSDLRTAVFDLMYPKDPKIVELSATTSRDISGNVSLRKARTVTTGVLDGSAFKVNGVGAQSFELNMPLFVQLKGDVSSAKATDAATGSVAYRLGNTVIGAIQGYSNSGAGFGIDSRQLETSVVASHSFGSFFVEGQIGSVSATEVHNSNWSGLRSQVTLGLDTEFVSPFVQVAHRQLDRSGLNLNETTAYVGLDAEVAKLAADTYSIDTRLLAKAGYGSKDWSANSKDLGSTTGFSGSVEWSSSLNLNSGVSFSSNLALDTVAGSSAALNVSLDR